MVRFSRSSLISLLCGIAALFALGIRDADARPRKPRKQRVMVAQLETLFELTDPRNRAFLCADVNGRQESGVQRGKRFVLDKIKAQNLRQKIKSERDSRKQAKLRKKLRNLKQRRRLCRTATPPPVEPPAPSTIPVAYPSSAAGAGIEPLAVSFGGDAQEPGATVRCVKVSDPVGATVEIFDEINCNALVRPVDHNTVNTSFQFGTVRDIDGAQSDPATVTLTWSQNGEFIGDYYSLARYKNSLSEAEATKLVMQAGLGKDRDELVQLAMGPNGLDAVLDRLFSPGDPQHCAAAEAKAMEIAYHHANSLCFTISGPDPDGETDDNGRVYTRRVDYCTKDFEKGHYRWNANAFATYWLHHLSNGCAPLRERIGLFYHNHFPVDLGSTLYEGSTNRRSHYIKAHLDLLRGNVPAADGGIATPFDYIVSRMHGADGAMLHYLNNIDNARPAGNENYARELLELMTLGQDPITGAQRYTEDDVYQMTYSVMGYYDPMQDEQDAELVNVCCAANNEYCGRTGFPTCQPIRNQLHFPAFSDTRWTAVPTRPELKRLFAGTPWERIDTFKANVFEPGQDMVTPYLLNSHPGVAQYLATRLIATFAAVEPTLEMVNIVAHDLKANNWRIEPALRRILSSSSFFSAQARNDGMANPIEAFVSFTRALELPILFQHDGSGSLVNLVSEVRSRLAGAGMSLGRPSSIFGWPEAGKITGGKLHKGNAFAANQLMLGRQRLMVRFLNDMDQARIKLANAGVGDLSWERFLDPTNPRSPEALIDRMARRVGIQLIAEERSAMLEYLTTLVLQTETDESGMTVPVEGKTLTISWSQLNDARFEEVVRLKVPGLIEILWGLASAHAK